MDIILDSLLGAILITGLVVVMMMLIESCNIGSHGGFLRRLGRGGLGQVALCSLLGSVPGCMGGYAVVSLYTHGAVSFGALVAMLIATAGDESFVMLAMFPGKALMIFAITFGLAIIAGLLTDRLARGRKLHLIEHQCDEGYAIHDADRTPGHATEMADHNHDTDDYSPVMPGLTGHPEHSHASDPSRRERHLTYQRVVLFVGVALFIVALSTGLLEHEHDAQSPEKVVAGINLLSEDWMNIMFAALSVIMLVVIVTGSDHFIKEHLWHHIVLKHLPRTFAWTFGVMLIIGILTSHIDIHQWISSNIPLMIVLASLIGLIPESGPHLMFVTLYASGVVPLPVLLASCISQDGHASLPLLAESPRSFAVAKLINLLLALVVGFAALLF